MKLIFSLILCLFLVGCNQTETTTNDRTVPEPTPDPTPVYYPLSIGYPNADVLIMAGTTFKYTVNGGLPPYSFQYISGPGTIATDGTFTAGTIPGNTIIDITDSASQLLRVRVRVNAILQSTPQNAKVIVGNNVLFNTTGGVPPYTYYIESGTGFINGIGLYTANATPGSATVKVYDSQGNFVTNTVQVNYALKINPTSIDVNRGDTFLFSASDGFPPYSYTLIGEGSINGITGSLIAPPSSQNITVRVIDSMGNTSDSQVVVNNRSLSLNNTNLTLEVNKSFGFKADGGLAPYTYSFVTSSLSPSSWGQILASGNYYAPASPAVEVIKVKDSEQNEVLANITVNDRLSISPAVMTTTPNRSDILYAHGGVPPYAYTIISGAGVVDNSQNNDQGVFVAPPTTGTTVVQLRDSVNTVVTSTIKTDPELSISPQTPTISIGNQIIFIGSGGIPPYSFDVFDGNQYGIMDVNGTFIANSSAIGSPVTVTIRLKDSVTASNNQAKFATLTINPAISFAEQNIVVKSGDTKIITAQWGVPPYTLRFKNGSSLIGSSIQNIPNGSGGYTMQYIAGFVADDVVEKLEITDSLNNKVSQNITVFGGLVAFTDPKKIRVSSSKTLAPNALSLTNNSDLANIMSTAHGLSTGSYIKIRSSQACANIDDYEFDKQYSVTGVDANNFVIKLLRKANLTTTCGSGSSYVYDVLNNNSSISCPGGGLMDTLNLRNYTVGEVTAKCLSSSFPFVYNAVSTSNPSVLAHSFTMNRTNNNYLNYNLPLTTDPDGFVTVEMWFRWNGDRSPETVPATPSFNGTLVSFNNYNVSFLTVKNSSNNANKALCFNTSPALDCYGMNNPDSLVKNRWAHYVFVFSNIDVTQNKIYINGQEKALNKQGTADAISREVSGQFRIGANVNFSGAVYQMGGDLGIIRVYDKKLNPSEVYNNYNEFKLIYQP